MALQITVRKKIFLILALFIYITAVFLYVATQKSAQALQSEEQTINKSLINNNITLYQFFQNKTPLNTVTISIPLNKSLKQPLRFTVFLDVNADGKFEGNELAVKNVPASVEKTLPNNFPVDFKNDKTLQTLLTLPENAEVKAKILVSDNNVTITKTVTAKKIFVDVGDVFDPAPGFTGLSFRQLQTESKNASDIWNLVQTGIPSVYGADVPVFHNGVPDLGGRKGKPNECVPLSLANSLIWLAKEHHFQEKIPEDTDGLLNELDTLLKWDKEGTKNENILPGKEAFTTNHELLLENKKIDGKVTNGESDLWKKIVKELNDGEDVELILDFKESPTGKPTKGHAVTVVGADMTKKSEQTITFHDPATPQGNDTYEVAKNGQIKNYPLGKVFGNFIISESFVGPSTTPSPSPSPSPSSSPTVVPSASVSPGST